MKIHSFLNSLDPADGKGKVWLVVALSTCCDNEPFDILQPLLDLALNEEPSSQRDHQINIYILFWTNYGQRQTLFSGCSIYQVQPGVELQECRIYSSARSLYYLSHHHVEFEINSNLARQELLITYCPIKIIRILNIFINVRPHPPKISSGPEVCRSSPGLISNVRGRGRGDIFQPSWPDSTRRGSSSSPEQLFKLAQD